MVSLNWGTAWEAWKLVLVGAGSLILIGILTVYLGSLFLSIFIVGVIGLTGFLYRKGAGG